MAEESGKKVREIRVIVDTKGAPDLRNLAKEFDRTSKSIRNVDGNLSKLKNAIFALQGISFLGFGIREFTDILDSTQKLNDRLKVLTGSAEEGKKAFYGLAEIADRTNTSITDIADSFARLAIPLGSIGMSTQAQLEFTEALVQSFRLSGSNAQEAANATVQLAQGLALGTLRGQDLKSVLSQNAIFGEILGRQLNITTAMVYKFAESGRIVSREVIQGMAKEFNSLNTQAAQLTPTIGESLTKAFNKVKIGLNEFNETAQLSAKFAATLDFAMDNAGKAALAFAAALVYLKGGAAIAALTAGLASLQGIFVSLATAAIIVTAPITLTGAAIAGAGLAVAWAIAYFVDFKDIFSQFKEELSDFRLADFQELSNFLAKFDGGILSGGIDSFVSSVKKLNSTKDLNGTFIQKLPDFLQDFQYNIKEIAPPLSKAGDALSQFASGMGNFVAPTLDALNNKLLDNKISLKEYYKELKQLRIFEVEKSFNTGGIDYDQKVKQINEIKFGKPIKEADIFKKKIAELNNEFKKNQDITAYARAFDTIELDRFNSQLDKGKENILEANAAMRDRQLVEYNRRLAEGTISLQSYNNQVRELKLLNLNEQLKAGTISQREYNKELQATSDKFMPGSPLQTGLQDYIESAGTLAQGVSGVVTGVFNNLENALVEFTKNGKFAFKDFANAVIEDINRVIIRSLIIRPLAEGILNSISAGSSVGTSTGNASTTASGSQYANYSAKGNVFDNGELEKFARGGVVNRATSFGMTNGRQGLMGEKGPEAIIPLKRGKNGELGVQAGSSGGSNVMVNITNNSGGEVEQKETTNSNGDRVLDILIHSKVKEGMANGLYDKQMSSNYGLRRKGK